MAVAGRNRYVSASDSAGWDGSPAFSRDGKTIYFASNRADCGRT